MSVLDYTPTSIPNIAEMRARAEMLQGQAEVLAEQAPGAKGAADFLPLAAQYREAGLTEDVPRGLTAEDKKLMEPVQGLGFNQHVEVAGDVAVAMQMALVAAAGRHSAIGQFASDLGGQTMIDLSMGGHDASLCDLCEERSTRFTKAAQAIPPFLFVGNYCRRCVAFTKEAA